MYIRNNLPSPRWRVLNIRLRNKKKKRKIIGKTVGYSTDLLRTGGRVKSALYLFRLREVQFSPCWKGLLSVIDLAVATTVIMQPRTGGWGVYNAGCRR